MDKSQAWSRDYCDKAAAKIEALGAVRELVAQMRHELAADKGWDYTAYEKGRIAEKQRCLSLLESALAQHPAPNVPVGIPPSGVAWHPIETAPKDNKHPLYLAQFNTETGDMIDLDWDASWEPESESWEIPQVYYVWRSANGRVEEPTHWAYQDLQQPAADKFAATFRCESNGVVGTMNAPIHSISMHDDGVIEVVIDHWPQVMPDEEAKSREAASAATRC